LSSTTKTAFAIGRPLGSEASTVLARNFLDAIITFPLCVQFRFVLGESYPLAAKRVIRHSPDSNVTVRLDRIPQRAGGAVVDGSLSALAPRALCDCPPSEPKSKHTNQRIGSGVSFSQGWFVISSTWAGWRSRRCG